VSGPTGDGPDAATLEAARYQGRRLAEITIRLLGGARAVREAVAATTSRNA
jgi:NAD(P)H dehydrogenase (quinone)